MKCDYCGAEYEGNFCPECGAKAETTTPAPTQEQSENDQQPMQGVPIKPTKKKKPFYMRWWFIAVVILVIISIAASTGNDGKNSKNKGKYEIPNVFGVNYEAATEILEADGFEVKAVETNPKDILNRLSYKVDTFEKGAVFKIDDYIQNGLGHIQDNDNYSDYKQMYSDDKSLVIYYTKEAYNKDEKKSVSEQENKTAEATKAPEKTEAPEKAETSSSSNTDSVTNSEKQSGSSGLRSDFKNAMDSYETFMNEYVDFMKKYSENPTDIGLLKDYATYMAKYADMVSKFEKWEDEDLNAAELAYYIDIQAKVNKKLLEVAQ